MALKHLCCCQGGNLETATAKDERMALNTKQEFIADCGPGVVAMKKPYVRAENRRGVFFKQPNTGWCLARAYKGS
jgi:hypothetical protein